jgi:transcriptional regulator with XRE-family HTH domain
MSYVIEHLLQNLREARVYKGLSQRELSARSGVPQSHISKIESGGVDLRMSSLIALARVLDLELFLAPQKSIPAIKSIIRVSQGAHGSIAEAEQMRPAYHLDGVDDG